MKLNIINFFKENKLGIIKVNSIIDQRDQFIQFIEEITFICREISIRNDISTLVIIETIPDLFAIKYKFKSPQEKLPIQLSLSNAIAGCYRPVIIGLRGNVLDLGLEMALACDFRVASDTSRFGLTYIKDGTMPCDGGTQRLWRTVGKGKALEMILTGDLIDAQEANRIGLVNRVVPADEVIPTVMGIATDMASRSPISLEYCKEAITKGMDLKLDQGLRLEADLYFLMHTTHDREEGIKAFQEKRKPKFKGE